MTMSEDRGPPLASPPLLPSSPRLSSSPPSPPLCGPRLMWEHRKGGREIIGCTAANKWAKVVWVAGFSVSVEKPTGKVCNAVVLICSSTRFQSVCLSEWSYLSRKNICLDVSTCSQYYFESCFWSYPETCSSEIITWDNDLINEFIWFDGKVNTIKRVSDKVGTWHVMNVDDEVGLSWFCFIFGWNFKMRWP